MFKSKKLSKFKIIKHGFFNRFGGVSKGIYKGLNCGLGSDDKIKDVRKNIEKVCLKFSCNKNNLILFNLKLLFALLAQLDRASVF